MVLGALVFWQLSRIPSRNISCVAAGPQTAAAGTALFRLSLSSPDAIVVAWQPNHKFANGIAEEACEIRRPGQNTAIWLDAKSVKSTFVVVRQ